MDRTDPPELCGSVTFCGKDAGFCSGGRSICGLSPEIFYRKKHSFFRIPSKKVLTLSEKYAIIKSIAKRTF
jgi:hypothetical protein